MLKLSGPCLLLTGLTKIEGDCCAFLLLGGISVHRGSRSICPFVDVSAGEHDSTQHDALQCLSITPQHRNGTCWSVQQLLFVAVVMSLPDTLRQPFV